MSLRDFQSQLYGLRTQGLKLRGIVPPTPRLAVVGSRAMMASSRDATRELVREAASFGFSLVSGGARGVDITAHREALRIGMPQLAVLPCGPDRVYPPEFSACFDEVAKRPLSGVLYGLREGTPPTRGSFASRNALVVGLSAATVVIQAARRSGSVVTGKLAAVDARVACAVFAGSPGCEALVACGAKSLGRVDAGDRQARVRTWLRSLLDPQAETPAELTWPPHLRWLREALMDAPEEGQGLHAFADPLEALCALTEAVTLSLVVEPSPGRYRLG